jgi:hypothetical protein
MLAERYGGIGRATAMRRLAVLSTLLAALAVAVPAASAQTEPRLAVTATSDHCAGGLPVVDYRVTNQEPTAVSAQVWWVADASVYGVASHHDLGPAPDSATGSFSLPFDFYSTVTVYATASWPDGQTITNASWAIPVANCTSPTPSTATTATTVTPTTTIEEPTTTTDGPGNNGNGYGRPPTPVETG